MTVRMSHIWALGLALITSAFLGCGPGDVDGEGQRQIGERGSATEVTDKFGPLYVADNSAMGGETWAVNSDLYRPWSSYWFPDKFPDMFEQPNGPSPLEKYDQYVKRALKRESRAAEYERERYNPHGSGTGDGLCHAWARAAILEPSPRELLPEGKIERNGVTFTREDIAALLIKTYEVSEGIEKYGNKYQAFRGEDLEDIYPDQFHRFLQVQLRDRRQPFSMDYDYHIGVWNVPVVAAFSRVTRDVHDPYVMHVETMVKYVKYVDTFEFPDRNKTSTFLYTYDLIGYPQPDGGIQVVAGFWTGESRDNHPDYVVAMPDRKVYQRKSKNPYVDPVVVDAILGRAAP